ncbi:MAG: YtxH domain-containing protein [Candidatus Sulfotelmatobacter sp.]
MNKLLKSVLKTVVYLLDQTEDVADDVRHRVSKGYDRVSDRVSDLRDQAADLGDRASDLYQGEDHTLRNVLTFAAGVGVGIGAALLLAPASGEEFRSQIGEKVQSIGGKVRDRFSAEGRSRTGTENL